MSASVAKTRAIALSYGVFRERGAVTPRALELANEKSVEVVKRLWENWGVDEEGGRKGEVDLYTVSLGEQI